jgi:hypothetical protein
MTQKNNTNLNYNDKLSTRKSRKEINDTHTNTLAKKKKERKKRKLGTV